MGSHVWGPMYLMRELLPALPPVRLVARLVRRLPRVPVLHGRPDAAGRGPERRGAVAAAGAGPARGPRPDPAPGGWSTGCTRGGSRWRCWASWRPSWSCPVPYGVAFKLVAGLGPASRCRSAAWALGKLSGCPFPVPPALALGSLFFIYNLEPTLNSGTGNIIGGNLTSTMAGEFSFSISLSLAVLYLGFLIRGLRTGKGRALTAGLLALCGLCHIIPAFYALAATALALVVWPGRARLRWFLPIGPVAGLLSAFWVVPVRRPPRLRERHGLGAAAPHRRRPAPGHLELPRPEGPAAPAAGRRGGPGRRGGDAAPPGLRAGRAHGAGGDRVRGRPRRPALERPAAAPLLPVDVPARRRSRWPRCCGPSPC